VVVEKEPSLLVLRDQRGDHRYMRASWHAGTKSVVLSQWSGGLCTASTRLALDDVRRLIGFMVGALHHAATAPATEAEPEAQAPPTVTAASAVTAASPATPTGAAAEAGTSPAAALALAARLSVAPTARWARSWAGRRRPLRAPRASVVPITRAMRALPGAPRTTSRQGPASMQDEAITGAAPPAGRTHAGP
jgi:hypothetical protein